MKQGINIWLIQVLAFVDQTICTETLGPPDYCNLTPAQYMFWKTKYQLSRVCVYNDKSNSAAYSVTLKNSDHNKPRKHVWEYWPDVNEVKCPFTCE